MKATRYMSGLLVMLFCLTAFAADPARPLVEMKTNFGSVTIELNPEAAPKTVENFLSYVKSGHYKGTVFHRVIENFMIQGGGFEPGMKQKPTQPPIQNEAANGLKNDTYTVAMARTGDPHSATAQFFINTVDNGFLNYLSPEKFGYCVFGKVVKGQEVVDKIKRVKTANKGGHANVPLDDVLIEDMKIVAAPTQSKGRL